MAKGEYHRDQECITSRITADGADGYPVEPGRYRLAVARACPWANRVIIVRRLQRVYFARFPGYPRGITGPAIVDIPTGQVVTNDFAQMTLDLSTEWRAYHRAGAPALYPRNCGPRSTRSPPWCSPM
jgi:putative glutathione S-transferase